MPPAAQSNNDRIRAFVGGLLDEGTDLSTTSNREQAFNDFHKKNPDIAKASARASWSKIVPKLAAERGINPDTVKARRAPKVKVDKTLITNLDPRPADINPNYQQGQQGPQGPQQGNWQWANQGQQQQFGQPQQGPAFQMSYSVASTGAFWDSVYNFLRLTTPDAEPLSEQERTSLGETWVAPFNYYLAGKEKTALAIALLATLSMFAVKIKPARDKAKREQAARGNIDQLRRAARAAGKKMPKPEAPDDTPAEPAKPRKAGPRDLDDDGDVPKEAPPGRYVDMRGMESESNE